MEINVADCAYLAGLLDGEGNFSLVKHINKTTRGWNYQPTLGVSNTDVRLLEWCKTTTGCGGYWNKDYKNRNKNHKKPYAWHVYDMEDICEMVSAVIPHLKSKFQQALLLSEFCLIRLFQRDKWKRQRDDRGRFIKGKLPYNKRQHEIFRELRELNHR